MMHDQSSTKGKELPASIERILTPILRPGCDRPFGAERSFLVGRHMESGRIRRGCHRERFWEIIHASHVEHAVAHLVLGHPVGM